MLLMLIGLAATLSENSLLRSPEGSLTRPDAPIMQAIVPLLFFMFAIPGLIYGFSSGTFKSTKDVTASMENITRSLVSFWSLASSAPSSSIHSATLILAH